MAHRCRYTGASVFDRRQKFCKCTARLDELVKLSLRSNEVEGQIEPEIKRCGPTRIRVLMHKCIMPLATLVRIKCVLKVLSNQRTRSCQRLFFFHFHAYKRSEVTSIRKFNAYNMFSHSIPPTLLATHKPACENNRQIKKKVITCT